MFSIPTDADIKAAHLLIGCETPGCPMEGVVEVQYFNANGPRWRSCRDHAKPYRSGGSGGRIIDPDPDYYSVHDSGRPNRRLLPITFETWNPDGTQP